MAKQRQVVDSVSVPAGMLKDLFRQIQDRTLTIEQLRVFLNHENPFGVWDRHISEWARFYQRHFGLDVDFSEINIITPDDPDFTRLIIVAQGLTLSQVYDTCAKQFPCWRWVDDLDELIVHNDRDAQNGSYAVWFRDRVEADEELKNISANQLTEQKILGITLLERMLYELKFWSKTRRKKLDIQNVTLCAGSRDAGGYVPRADWHNGQFCVGRFHSSYFSDILRARAAIPCPPKVD